jgi:hypothetical protein
MAHNNYGSRVLLLLEQHNKQVNTQTHKFSKTQFISKRFEALLDLPKWPAKKNID